MNHTYRLVRNARSATVVAVAETSRARGKTGAAIGRALSAAALLAMAATHAWAADLPTGGQVAAGTGQIVQAGRTMTVVQGSNRLVTNWRSFDVAPGGTVNFVQPSASAVALNRVVGADVSRIQGALNANGQVFLVNPNGILFTSTAQVNVGGLVASTLNLTDSDFLAGRYRFEGAGGTIVNQGAIGAQAGGTIAMIAARIVNDGRLAAEGGNVLLGAGTKVTLDMGGPVRLEVERGALDALVRNGGAIVADGGTVLLTARAADALNAAVINNTGLIEARTLATGAQGQILLLSDMANGRAEIGGRLDASAPAGGNGGFIETSAATVQTLPGLAIDAGAARGTGGQWLIDPYDYTIGAAQAATIGSALNTGTSVTVSTLVNNASFGSAGSSGGNGDITVASAILKTGGGAATLTLLADRNILVNSNITSSAGPLGIVLSAANGANAATGGVKISGNLVSNGGNIGIGGAATAGGAFAPIGGLGYARNLDANSPAVWITAGTTASPRSILAGGGDITINGWSSTGGSGGSYDATRAGVYIEQNSVIRSGGGNIVLTGRTTGYSRIFGIGFQGGPGTQSLIETSSTGGTLLLSGWNTTGVGGANNDAGAVGLMNNGSAEQVSIAAHSVAHVLTLINGSPTVATFSQTGLGCTGPYTNCGGLQVLGTNNSYLYAGYQAINPSTHPLYVLPTGSKTYDGTTAATGLTYTALGGPSGFAVGSLGPLSFVTPSRNAGVYSALRDAPGSTNPGSHTSGGTTYAVAYFGNYTITPKPVTPVAADKVYDGTAQASLSASGLLAGDQVAFGFTSGAFSGVGVGSHAVSASGIVLSGPDAGNYSLTGTSLTNASAQITPRPVTLSGGHVYDGSGAITAGELALANLVAGESLTLSGAGSVSSANAGAAQALALGSLALSDGTGGLASNYTIASTGNTATIAQRVLNATGSRVYDRTTNAAASDLTLANLVAGESLALSGTGTAASHNVGTRSVNTAGLTLGNGTGGLASNYTLAGGTHALAITARPVTPTAVDKVYDGTTQAALALGGVLTGDSVTLTSGPATFAGADVGVHAVGASGLALGGTDAGNYTLPGGTLVSVTAQITPRPVSTGGSRVYDGTALFNAGDLTLSNLVAGQALALSGTASTSSPNAGAMLPLNVGGLTLGNGAGGGVASNYTFAGGTHAATITPRPLAATGSRAYDGTAVAAAADLALGNLVPGESLVLTGAGSVASAHAGAAQALTPGSLALGGGTGGTASNYTLAGGTLTITPRPVNLAGSRPYDGTNAVGASGLSLANVVPGEALSLSGAGSVASANAGVAQPLLTTGLTLGNGVGGLASDYTFAGGTASVTITPRPVNVTADAQTRAYGDANPALTYAAEASGAGRGLLAGETLSGGLATPATTASDAGTYSIGLGTLANPNYLIAFAPGPLVVTPRLLTLTGSRSYDGTTTFAASDLVLSNLVPGQALVLGGAGSVARADAGTAQPLALGSLLLADGPGGRAANYVLGPGSASAIVVPRPIRVTADPQTKPVGAQDPTLTWSVAPGMGLVGNDRLGGSPMRDPGEAAGRYAIGQGTLANSNYAIAFTAGAFEITSGPTAPAPSAPQALPTAPEPAATGGDRLTDPQQALPRPATVPRFTESAGPLFERTITSQGGLTYVPVSSASTVDAGATSGGTAGVGSAPFGSTSTPDGAAPLVTAAEAAGASRNVASAPRRGVVVERTAGAIAPATVWVVDGGINAPGVERAE